MAWYEALLLFVFLGLFFIWLFLALREEARYRRLLQERDRAIIEVCSKLSVALDDVTVVFED